MVTPLPSPRLFFFLDHLAYLFLMRPHTHPFHLTTYTFLCVQMLEWLAWRPPAKVCVSWKGIFTHYEVDQ